MWQPDTRHLSVIFHTSATFPIAWTSLESDGNKTENCLFSDIDTPTHSLRFFLAKNKKHRNFEHLEIVHVVISNIVINIMVEIKNHSIHELFNAKADILWRQQLLTHSDRSVIVDAVARAFTHSNGNSIINFINEKLLSIWKQKLTSNYN